MVVVHRESRSYILQHFNENLFRHFCLSQLDGLCWLTERSAPRQIIADSSTIVVLFAVDNDTSVPNAINLAADKLA